MVRRRDINPARFNRVAVFRVRRRQRPAPVQNVRQNAVAVSGHVQDNEDGGCQSARQSARKFRQGFDAAGGSADYDNIMPSLGGSRAWKRDNWVW